MPWPCAGSGADSWDCLSGGGSAPQLHPTAAGAGHRGGAKPRHCCHGLPGVSSASLARGTGDAEQGCGDRASSICGCSASVTPVCPQLIPSLQLPNPFGFVVGFYFFYLFSFSPLTHKSSARSVRCACATHAALPPAPVEPHGTPSSARPSTGLLPPLHPPQLSELPHGDSPLLWAGVWAGTETPVLMQIPLAL